MGGRRLSYLLVGNNLNQSCLSYILNCFLSFFKIPILVALKINKRQKNFQSSRGEE